MSQDSPSFQTTSFHQETQSSLRVSSLTQRFSKNFLNEPELPTTEEEEISAASVRACVSRCRDIIGNGRVEEREFALIQDTLREHLSGLIFLKEELANAQKEQTRLEKLAEPFLESMAPLLAEESSALSGLDSQRIVSLQETLTELVQGLSFAQYRHDQLLGRLEKLVTLVTDQLIDALQARNLGHPHLSQIRAQVTRAINEL